MSVVYQLVFVMCPLVIVSMCSLQFWKLLLKLFGAYIQRVALRPFSFLSPNSMCSDDVYESDSAHKHRTAWHKCHQRKVAQRKRRRPYAAGYTHGTDRGGGAGEDDDVTMETNPHAELHHARVWPDFHSGSCCSPRAREAKHHRRVCLRVFQCILRDNQEY